MPGQSRVPPTSTSTSTSTAASPSVAAPSNAAVASGIGPTGGGSGTPTLAMVAGQQQDPAWAGTDISAVQRELARLGLYSLRIDTTIGRGTRTGLDTVFPGGAWRTMSAADVLTQLRSRPTPGVTPPTPEPVQPGTPGEAPPPSGGAQADPRWSGAEISAIQRELSRLTLYTMRIDTTIGRGMRAGLVEAFGSEEWRSMAAAAVLERLRGATPPAAGVGNSFRYGEMFKDGVIDLTIGLGFDEGGNHISAIAAFQEVLSERGFSLNAARAQQLYAQAGRAAGNAEFGQYYVLENALMYTPPVGGDPRPIHAVVRFVFSETGAEGGQASAAFNEGMAESDVAYYSGHGRYGSGPDFDRNMAFELLDRNGAVTQEIDDYEVLERVLRDEGRPAGRGAWSQFQWRARNNRIRVDGSNAGNVFLNATNQHAGEFGANLMYWNLQREGQGAQLQTGAANPLATNLQGSEARNYRVVVFDGCRTQDYVRSVRNTPGMAGNAADVLATTRTLNWGDEAKTLGTFLDGIIARTNRAGVITAMDQQQSPSGPGGQQGGAYRGY